MSVLARIERRLRRSSEAGPVLRGLAAGSLLLLFAGPAAAQLSAFQWSLAGNTTGRYEVSPLALTVTGPEVCFPVYETWVETQAPVDGTVRCTLEYILLDFSTLGHNHHPIVVVDGEYWIVGDSKSFSATYELAIPVQEGQSFGFGVQSTSCSGGPAITVVTNLFFDPGTWVDVGEALDPRRRVGLHGESTGGHHGATVSTAGDVDGDGWGDVAVGAPDEDRGRVRLFSGRDGSLLRLCEGDGRFGAALALVGDINGDGQPEIVVGSPQRVGPGNAEQAGHASVIDARTGLTWHEVAGTSAGWQLGTAVAGPGDLDDDGHDDFAVSVPFSGGSLHPNGRVLVYSGTDAAQMFALFANISHDQFGSSLAAAGDVDGDGHPDILSGARGSGHAYVHSGRDGSLLLDLTAPVIHKGFGTAVSGAGDIDGDGTTDLAVAEESYATFVTSGSVYLFSGRTGALLATWSGTQAGEAYGAALAGGRDVDGDGAPDLAIGAPGHRDADGDLVGRVELRHGAALIAAFDGGVGDAMGTSVALIDDVNGDGLTDLLTGSPEADHLHRGLAEIFDDLDGSPGQRPKLSGLGNLVPDTHFQVRLQGARPLALSLAFVGWEADFLPLAGGMLVPGPGAQLPLVTDEHGDAVVGGLWPASLMPFTRVYAQIWTLDPVGPQGLSASNGLQATTALSP